MPRLTKTVKPIFVPAGSNVLKSARENNEKYAKKRAPKPVAQTRAAVDLHFHGAFGIDLMVAPRERLRELSARLADHGVGAICATTLSADLPDLERAVIELGAWTRSRRDQPGARVLGLHLEGPYLNRNSRGAHPSEAIRPFRPGELERLWELSEGTLKILTLAPETIAPEDLTALAEFGRKKKIRLSLGHSCATETEAASAFERGFSGVTHLWNALSFHHRDAGALGAALAASHVKCELIPDGVHVSPSVRTLTETLFRDRLCLVSDAAPAAGLPDGEECSFGPLRCAVRDGAARTATGLAGGGYLLPEMVRRWLTAECPEMSPAQARRWLKARLSVLGRAMSDTPLRAISLDPKTAALRTLDWFVDERGAFGYRPRSR